MYSDNEIELTADERALLAALPRELKPSDLLEERVVSALRRDGRFGAQRRNRALANVLKAAAAIALFAGGVATGRYLLMPVETRSASAEQRETMRPDNTVRPVQQSLPAGGEMIVAEREIWM